LRRCPWRRQRTDVLRRRADQAAGFFLLGNVRHPTGDPEANSGNPRAAEREGVGQQASRSMTGARAARQALLH